MPSASRLTSSAMSTFTPGLRGGPGGAKPARLSFEQAAAVPLAATTALRGIRDVGQVTAGQRALVNGAGGVGSYAAQIAHVIDYTTDDFTRGRTHYDVILDNVSSLPLSRLRRALTPKGTLVLNGGGSPGHVFGPVATLLRAVVANAFISQRLRPLPSRQNREELLAVTRLIENGKLTPVVGRTYPLADTAEGLRYVEQGHARGKAVVTVA